MGRGGEDVLLGCDADCCIGRAHGRRACKRDQEEGAGEQARSTHAYIHWKENQGSGRIRGRIPHDSYRIVNLSVSVWVCMVCISFVASARMSSSANARLSLPPPEGPSRRAFLPLRGGGIGMGMPAMFGSAIDSDVGKTGGVRPPTGTRPRMHGLQAFFPDEPPPLMMPRASARVAMPPSPPLDSDLERSAVRRNSSPPVLDTFPSQTTRPANFRGSATQGTPQSAPQAAKQTAERAGVLGSEPLGSETLGSDPLKELGMVAEEWVKSRGSRKAGKQPVEELQQEIDSLIERWTAAAAASPEKAMTSTTQPHRGEDDVGLAAQLQPKSPSFEVLTTGKKKLLSMADLGEGYVDDESSGLLDENGGYGEAPRDTSTQAHKHTHMAVRERSGEALEDWSMYNWVDSEAIMLSSHAALDELSDRLDAQGLAEMWVDPDGDCLLVALVQQFARQPSIRESLEAKGYDFEAKANDFEVTNNQEPGSGPVVLGRYPAAAHKCRTDVAAYMSIHTELSLLEGIPTHNHRAYLSAIAQPGTWCGMREVHAAAALFNVDIICYDVSHSGLQELHSLPPHNHTPAHPHNHTATQGQHQPRAVLRLVKCGSHFWSVVPQSPQATPQELQPHSGLEVLHYQQIDDGDLPDSSTTSPHSAPSAPSSSQHDTKPQIAHVSFSSQEPDLAGSTTPAKRQIPEASDVSQETPPAGRVGTPPGREIKPRSEEMKTFSEWQKKLRSVPSVVKAYWQHDDVAEQDKARARRRIPSPAASKNSDSVLLSDEEEEADVSVVDSAWTTRPQTLAVDEHGESQGERAMMEEFFRETINLATPRAGNNNVFQSARKQPSSPPEKKEVKVDVGLGDTVGLLLSHMAQMEDKRAEQMLKMQEQQTAQVEKMCEAMALVGKGAKDSMDAQRERERQQRQDEQDNMVLVGRGLKDSMDEKRKQEQEQDENDSNMRLLHHENNKKPEAAARDKMTSGGDTGGGETTARPHNHTTTQQQNHTATQPHSHSGGTKATETKSSGVAAEAGQPYNITPTQPLNHTAGGAEERWIELEKKVQEHMLAMQDKMLSLHMEQMKGLATQAHTHQHAGGKPRQQQGNEEGNAGSRPVVEGRDSLITARLLAAIPAEAAPAWPPAPSAAAASTSWWSQQPPHYTPHNAPHGHQWRDPLLDKTLQMQRAATEATERVRRTQAELDAVMEEAARKKANAELLHKAVEEVQAIRQRMAETSEHMLELHREEQAFAHQLRRGVLPQLRRGVLPELRRGVLPSSSLRTRRADAWQPRHGGARPQRLDGAAAAWEREGMGKQRVGGLAHDELEHTTTQAHNKVPSPVENKGSWNQRGPYHGADAHRARAPVGWEDVVWQPNVRWQPNVPTDVGLPNLDHHHYGLRSDEFNGHDNDRPSRKPILDHDYGPLDDNDDYPRRSSGEWERLDGGMLGGRGRDGERSDNIGQHRTTIGQALRPTGALDEENNVWAARGLHKHSHTTTQMNDDDAAEASLTRKLEVSVPMRPPAAAAAADHTPSDRPPGGQQYTGQQRYTGQRYEPRFVPASDIRGGSMAGRGDALGMMRAAERGFIGDENQVRGLVGGERNGIVFRGGLETERSVRFSGSAPSDLRSVRLSSNPSEFRRQPTLGEKKKQKGGGVGGPRGSGPREVEELLAGVGLSGYEEVLLRNGWDTPQRLKLITEDDLIELGVKKGHARVMVDSIAALFTDS